MNVVAGEIKRDKELEDHAVAREALRKEDLQADLVTLECLQSSRAPER